MPPSDPDLIVEHMQRWVSWGLRMPRSYEAAGVAYPFASDSGLIGHLLPGRGFMPSVDLRALGITRQPPGIYDPSRFQRARDRFMQAGHSLLRSEVGAITTQDDVFRARGSGKGQDVMFSKQCANVANIWESSFQDGDLPPAGNTPSTTPPTDLLTDRTTLGALGLSNPSGGDKKYLLTFGFYARTSSIMCVILVDILNLGGIFRASVNTAEIVASPTLPTRQYSAGNGIGNLLTFWPTSGCTPFNGANWTVTYVDENGANTAAPTLICVNTAVGINSIFLSSGAAGTSGGSFFMRLAAASLGVQAVKQTLFSAAGTGDLTSCVFYPLLFVPGAALNTYVEADSTDQLISMKELVTSGGNIGCLAMFVLASGPTDYIGYVRTCAG